MLEEIIISVLADSDEPLKLKQIVERGELPDLNEARFAMLEFVKDGTVRRSGNGYYFLTGGMTHNAPNPGQGHREAKQEEWIESHIDDIDPHAQVEAMKDKGAKQADLDDHAERRRKKHQQKEKPDNYYVKPEEPKYTVLPEEEKPMDKSERDKILDEVDELSKMLGMPIVHIPELEDSELALGILLRLTNGIQNEKIKKHLINLSTWISAVLDTQGVKPSNK